MIQINFDQLYFFFIVVYITIKFILYEVIKYGKEISED